MDARHPPLIRRELAVLATLLVAGLCLRVWGFASTGIDHYDEGVYAFSAGMVGGEAKLSETFPYLHLFAPPAYYGIAGTMVRVTGMPADQAAILLNMVLGSLMIVIMWWAARSWFGPRAGIVSAALISLNEFHIGLSRTALTDVAFALFLLVALWLIVNALEEKRVRLAIVAGMAVGLAWNTKYHGWLAQTIVAAALVPMFWTWHRSKDGRSVKVALLWGLITGIAILCYVPWALYIQSQPGGYAEMAAYQRTMLGTEWLNHLAQQVRMQMFLDGPFSRAAPLTGLLAAGLICPGGARVKLPWLALIVVASIVLGGAATTVLLAALAVPILLRPPWRLPTMTLLAWLGVFLVLSPFYAPYARLVLPSTVAVCLAAGVGLKRVFSPVSEASDDRAPDSRRWIATVAIAAIAVAGASTLLRDFSNPWKPSNAMRTAAAQMAEQIPAEALVLTPGEPSVAYYLRMAGKNARGGMTADEVTATLERNGDVAYVVFGIYPRRRGMDSSIGEQLGDRLAYVESFPVRVKDVRLLDDFRPREARAEVRESTGAFDLKLYRYEP